jgi:hypothetical protein
MTRPKDRGSVSGRAVNAVDRPPEGLPPRATRAVPALICPFRGLPGRSSTMMFRLSRHETD